ncbi:hypothetical protein K461DRAFT_324549 [Myriangium duriaei CBS 260.36]|uniref:Uncharacterized protein n=1 Tax=Myriangium duriaei CBS 260.36 TaxID=1168546 RepID=A0A9P4MDF7_9PEZI|nr:hypothetical protein K461DRAFT_324549 [Myriangium duriaei CBS 260.36]
MEEQRRSTMSHSLQNSDKDAHMANFSNVLPSTHSTFSALVTLDEYTAPNHEYYDMQIILRLVAAFIGIAFASSIRLSALDCSVPTIQADLVEIHKHITHPVFVCSYWLGTNRTVSPLPAIKAAHLVPDCECILHGNNAKIPAAGSGLSVSAGAVPDIYSVPCVTQYENTILEEFKYIRAFCFFMQTLKKSSTPISIMTVPQIMQGCRCLLPPAGSSITSTTKRTTQTSVETVRKTTKITVLTKSSTTNSKSSLISSSTTKLRLSTTPSSYSIARMTSTLKLPGSTIRMPSTTKRVTSTTRIFSTKSTSAVAKAIETPKPIPNNTKGSTSTSNRWTPSLNVLPSTAHLSSVTPTTKGSNTRDMIGTRTATGIGVVSATHLESTTTTPTYTGTTTTTPGITTIDEDATTTPTTATVVDHTTSSASTYTTPTTSLTNADTTTITSMATRTPLLSTASLIPSSDITSTSSISAMGTNTITESETTTTMSSTSNVTSRTVTPSMSIESGTTTSTTSLVFTSTTATPAPTQYILNPSFEIPGANNTYRLPWTFQGNTSIVTAYTYSGGRASGIGESTTGSINQIISGLTIGGNYVLSFFYYMADTRNKFDRQNCTLTTTFDNSIIDSFYISTPSGSFLKRTVAVSLVPSTTITLSMMSVCSSYVSQTKRDMPEELALSDIDPSESECLLHPGNQAFGDGSKRLEDPKDESIVLEERLVQPNATNVVFYFVIDLVTLTG